MSEDMQFIDRQIKSLIMITDGFNARIAQLEAERDDLQARLDSAEALLPGGWYADRTLEFRLEMLVEQWRKLLEVNKELEGRLDSTSALVEAVKHYATMYQWSRQVDYNPDSTNSVNVAWERLRSVIDDVARQTPTTPTGQGHVSVGQDSGD